MSTALPVFIVLKQKVFYAISQSQPAGFNDIGRAAYSPPLLLAIAGLNKNPHLRTGAGTFFQNTHLVVNKLNSSQIRIKFKQSLSQSMVEGIHRTIALGSSMHYLI